MAVRPLADNSEMQLAAVGLLEKMADEAQTGAHAAIERWDAVDAAKQRPWLKGAFLAVLVGLSAWAWTVAGYEALTYWRLQEVSVLHRFQNDPDYPVAVKMLGQCLPGNLTKQERWLLLGDPSKSTRVEAMKSLWDSAPDDPAFHMEYVFSEYGNSRRGGPLDFLETARRLDPGNSWPFYAAGALQMRKAIEMVQLTRAERDAKVVPSWRILDQGKLDEWIALFHEASQQPGFDTYQPRLMKMRKGLIPVDDHLSYLTAGKILWFDEWGNGSYRGLLGVFLSAAAAKSQLLVVGNDRDGLARLIADIEILNNRWANSEIDSWMDESNYWKVLSEAIPRLHVSAVALGLTKEAGHLAGMIQVMEMQRKRERKEYISRTWFEIISPTLFFAARRYFEEPRFPARAAGALKPGRMADHELLSRGCCLVVWLIFGLGVLVLALYRFRLPRLILRLAARIAELLDARDHAWIVGAGVVLPYGFTMVINQLTPLGGQDWSIVGNHLMLPMAQFFGMAVLMLLVPILVARWRLGKKAAVLGMAAAPSVSGTSAVVCAAALIPVFGLYSHGEPSLEWNFLPHLFVALFLLVFPVFWLVSNAFRAVFGSGELRLLHRAVISRALIPAYATAMLLMVMAAPIHKAAERAWFRRDTTMTSVPGFPAVSPYDYRVAEEIRRDIREVLGMK